MSSTGSKAIQIVALVVGLILVVVGVRQCTNKSDPVSTAPGTTSRPTVVEETTSIRDAAETMVAGHFRHLPVVNAFAERAKQAGVEECYFDRGGFLFHGKIKALAEAAREGGLKF